MNEGMVDLTQTEAMGLLGSAIRSIADGNFRSARADIRTALVDVEELLENEREDDKVDAFLEWAKNAAGTPSEKMA